MRREVGAEVIIPGGILTRTCTARLVQGLAYAEGSRQVHAHDATTRTAAAIITTWHINAAYAYRWGMAPGTLPNARSREEARSQGLASVSRKAARTATKGGGKGGKNKDRQRGRARP